METLSLVSRFSLLISSLFIAFVSVSVSYAADPNGYTAEYECRAGNPRCDVDIASLATLACDQTITTSTPPTSDWSAINWNNNVICIEAGDHTGRGTLTIQASGTAGARKVLRYTRANDSNDEPWNQGGNQARLRDLVLNGASFWAVHRLTFPASGAAATPGDYRVELVGLATDNIFSRLLVEGHSSVPSFSDQLYGGIGSTTASSHRTTIQNSVIRTNYSAGSGAACVGAPPLGDDVRLVNNEIYDWCEHNYQQGENNTPTLGGSVLENNDVYYNNPNFTGHAEDNVVFKATGTASNPQRVIHNRIWGTRWATMCCDGGGGSGLFIAGQDASPYNTVNYVLVQNNIIFDNIYGVGGYPGNGSNHSVVGNLLYNHHRFNGGHDDSSAFPMWGVGGFSEFYLNTVVDSDRYFDFQGANNQDIRCDVVIAAGPSVPSMGGGSQIDRNVYYQTTHNGEINRIDAALNTRANATTYSVGDIIRTAAAGNCVAASNSACFLYKVTAAGISASTPPIYCTDLGCTTNDGSMTVQAVRGPYVFKRKLRTAPEDFVIPYARVHSSADEATFCTEAGNRPGIGINDDTLGTPAPSLFANDLRGITRTGTAGALEASVTSPPPSAQQPFHGAPITLPNIVQAEDFDLGAEGIAFHDSTTTNEGLVYEGVNYRSTSVDIVAVGDVGGGHAVGYVTPGEWLEYTVEVANAGLYDIEVRYATEGQGGTMHIDFNEVNKTGSIALPDTGGWLTWQTLTHSSVALNAGVQVMRVAFDTPGASGWLPNINYLRIVPSSQTPYSGTPAPIPGTVQVENFDNGGEGVAFHDDTSTNEGLVYEGVNYRSTSVDIVAAADVGGGYAVGYVTPGEWLEYTVEVASAGTYDIEIRYATQGTGDLMHIEFNGVNKSGNVVLPDTGGWQTWGTVTRTGVTLEAGVQIMRLAFDSGGADGWLPNFNAVTLIRR